MERQPRQNAMRQTLVTQICPKSLKNVRYNAVFEGMKEMSIEWDGISSWQDRIGQRLLPVRQHLSSMHCRQFFPTPDSPMHLGLVFFIDTQTDTHKHTHTDTQTHTHAKQAMTLQPQLPFAFLLHFFQVTSCRRRQPGEFHYSFASGRYGCWWITVCRK